MIRRFFSQGHARTIAAKRNIAGSFLNKGGSIVVGLLLVPLTIHYVNPAQYGIWLTLSSIITWMSFFDIGLGNGLRNKFAEARVKGEHELARTYVSTTYAVLAMISAGLALLFFAINPFLNWPVILNAPESMAGTLRLTALIVFLLFFVQFTFQLISILVIALQKPAFASGITFLGNLLSLATIFVMTKTVPGSLPLLALAMFAAPLLVLAVISIVLFKTLLRDYSPSVRWIRMSHARELMGLGVKFFIIQIAAIILYQTSNMIIIQLFGPEDVTAYNIAFRYLSVASMAFMIILSPYWSAYTEAYTNGEYEWIRSSVDKLKKVFILAAVALVLMTAVSKTVYHIWIGDTVMVPFTLTLVIAINTASNIWNSIYLNFLNGIGKIKLQLILTILVIFINIPLSIFFAKSLELGIPGVILGSLFCNILFSLFTPLQYSRIITGRAKGVWNQ